ncbi:MAG: universal stress protein [Marinibacterium sp.]|nr:universal stress protein [Marinibacterium sp.]
MTRHVLCAVDLTHETEAREIILRAAAQAEPTGATLSVMTVIPDYGSSWVGSFFKDGTLKGAAQAASDRLHKLVDETLPGHGKVQHIVEIGNVYERVLAGIETAQADLVVVGAHKPDFTERVMGPNAARIVRHAPVSVLVLRV